MASSRDEGVREEVVIYWMVVQAIAVTGGLRLRWDERGLR